MEKEKTYNECRFSADVLYEVVSKVEEIASQNDDELSKSILKVTHDDSIWNYDTFEEFLSDYRKFSNRSSLLLQSLVITLSIFAGKREAEISVRSTNRNNIEQVFNIIEKHVQSSILEPLPKSEPISPVVFIGHGRSLDWKELKDHLHEKHGVTIEAFETGARAGHTIRDILEEMASKSTFALLVLTSEDEQSSGEVRARQNVIHEAGLFQGRLGFSRAILLLEEGVEEFSNVQGIQYIKFSKNNIKETFGEVLATLRREFPNHG